MFKVNNRNTRTRFEICSKLTIKTPERRQWRQCLQVFYKKAVIKNLANSKKNVFTRIYF